jgi:hypothetical protein
MAEARQLGGLTSIEGANTIHPWTYYVVGFRQDTISPCLEFATSLPTSAPLQPTMSCMASSRGVRRILLGILERRWSCLPRRSVGSKPIRVLFNDPDRGNLDSLPDEMRSALRGWAQRCVNIRRLYMFGSRAKGTALQSSDLDLAVVLNEMHGNELSELIVHRRLGRPS